MLLILVTLVSPLPFTYCTLFLIFIHISLQFAFFITRLCVIYYVHISFQFISDVRILLHSFILTPLFYIFMKYPKWHVDSASFSHFYALVTHNTFKSFHVISQSLLFTQQFPSVIMLNPFLVSLCTVCQFKPMCTCLSLIVKCELYPGLNCKLCASMPGLHKIRRTCQVTRIPEVHSLLPKDSLSILYSNLGYILRHQTVLTTVRHVCIKGSIKFKNSLNYNETICKVDPKCICVYISTIKTILVLTYFGLLQMILACDGLILYIIQISELSRLFSPKSFPPNTFCLFLVWPKFQTQLISL